MKLVSFLIIVQFLLVNFSKAQLQSKIDNFVAYPAFENASISFKAVDCETGEVIGNYNGSTSLPPASTVKLFSTATSLLQLGANYQPETRIYAENEKDSNGVIEGNLWIRGGGDMSLGSKYFHVSEDEQEAFLQEWANEIAKTGIKVIHGHVIVDGSEFGYEGAPDGWSWSDLGNYYGAGFSGITVFDNMLQYHFKTTSVGKISTLTRTFPRDASLRFNNFIEGANVRGDNSYIYGAPYSYERFGTGSIPANQSDFIVKGSLPDPEEILAFELQRALKKQGINVTGLSFGFRSAKNANPNYSNFKLIHSYKGQPLLAIATLTNHKSINLFAEGLLCLIGYNANGDGSTANSLKQLDLFWNSKINTKGLYLTDGSGLSRTNAVSASHYCDLLKYVYKSKEKDHFIQTLPTSGISGTLKSVCRNQSAHGRVHAKSGTMRRIKSYAGYIDSESGKTIAFAVIMNNYNCSNSVTVDQMEVLFNAMARL